MDLYEYFVDTTYQERRRRLWLVVAGSIVGGLALYAVGWIYLLFGVLLALVAAVVALYTR